MKDIENKVRTEETKEAVLNAESETVEEQTTEETAAPEAPASEKLTPEAIFAKLTELQDLIGGAFAFDNPVPAEAIQKMVGLYEKMYDDLRPKVLPEKLLLDELRSMSKDPTLDEDMREFAKDRIHDLVMGACSKVLDGKAPSENKAEFDPKAETVRRMNAILDDPNASEQMKSDAITTLGMIMVNH